MIWTALANACSARCWFSIVFGSGIRRPFSSRWHSARALEKLSRSPLGGNPFAPPWMLAPLAGTPLAGRGFFAFIAAIRAVMSRPFLS